MQKIIGTKRLKATPMTRGVYNEYRGWNCPKDENPDDTGNMEEYQDGGVSNQPNHEGYISWSSTNVFEQAYHPIQCLTFGEAIEAMKSGLKVAREGWNGKNMFLFLVGGSTFKVNRPPLLGIYPEGTEINYHAHIDMRTADGTIVPWLATQTDMLAEDWVIVD
jgi:hypothetical protein